MTMALVPDAAIRRRAIFVSSAALRATRMPAFKRRTKQEKRNRERKKLERQIRHRTSFPVSQPNQLAWLERFIDSEIIANNMDPAWVQEIRDLIRTLRLFGQSCDHAALAVAQFSSTAGVFSNDT